MKFFFCLTLLLIAAPVYSHKDCGDQVAWVLDGIVKAPFGVAFVAWGVWKGRAGELPDPPMGVVDFIDGLTPFQAGYIAVKKCLRSHDHDD